MVYSLPGMTNSKPPTPLTARKVFSKVFPEIRFFTFVRTKADPLPGFTCKNSKILQGLPMTK